MKRKRFSEEQIIPVLKEAQAGTKASDLWRQIGISLQTFCRWKSKHGRTRFPRPRDSGNWKRKPRAEAALDEEELDPPAWTELLERNSLRHAQRRDAARYLVNRGGCRERRAHELVGASRMAMRSRAVDRGDSLLRQRLKELAAKYPNTGISCSIQCTETVPWWLIESARKGSIPWKNFQLADGGGRGCRDEDSLSCSMPLGPIRHAQRISSAGNC